MKVLRRGISACLPLACLLLAGAARAEPAWHTHALRAYAGYVDNAATLDARDGFEELDLGADSEIGLALTAVYRPGLDVDFALGRLKATGTLRKPTSSQAGADDTAGVSLEQTTLYVTGRWRLRRGAGQTVPWLGAGGYASLISADGESNAGESLPRKSGNAGVCGAAGVDLYPASQSALALTAEARWRISLGEGSFHGNTDGLAVLVGLKWDFGLRTDTP